MSSSPLFILIPLNILLLGLCAAAWRGRRVATPATCRKCGFEVESVIAGGAAGKRCPECGSDLEAPNALRRFRRRRRPVLLGILTLLLVVSSAVFVPRAVRFVSSGAWLAQLPEEVLERVIKFASGKTLKRAAIDAQRRAWTYAEKQDTESLARLARACLARQQDMSRAWEPLLGPVIERAYDMNVITKSEGLRFIRAALKVDIEFFRLSKPGEAIYRVGTSAARFSDNNSYMGDSRIMYESYNLRATRMWVRIESLALDGTPLSGYWSNPVKNMYDSSPFTLHCIGGGAVSITRSIRVPVEDVTRELRMTYSIAFDDQVWTEELRGQLELISAAPDVVEPTTDPKLAEAMHRLFNIQAFITHDEPGQPKRVAARIRFAGAGAPVCLLFSPAIEGGRALASRNSGIYPWSVRADEFLAGSHQAAFDLPEIDVEMPEDWDGKLITVVLEPQMDLDGRFAEEISTVLKKRQRLRLWNQSLRYEVAPEHLRPGGAASDSAR